MSHLRKPSPPEDFLQFWERTAWSHIDEPLTIERTHRDSDDTDTYTVDRLSFSGADGQRIHGWFGVPKESPGYSIGGLLWLPVYGFNALEIGHHSTLPGFATFSINLLGFPVDFSEQYDSRTAIGGYMAKGLETRETYIFRKFVITALRALDVLAQQPEVDPEKLVAAGMSQGGGLSLWLTTLTNRLKAVCADMPFFADHHEYRARQMARYPYREIFDFLQTHPGMEEEVNETLRYFDTLNFAPHARCPAQLSYGTKDPAVRPGGVKSVLAALPEPKNLIVYENGHEWVPTMPQNNLAWVRQFL